MELLELVINLSCELTIRRLVEIFGCLRKTYPREPAGFKFLRRLYGNLTSQVIMQQSAWVHIVRTYNTLTVYIHIATLNPTYLWFCVDHPFVSLSRHGYVFTLSASCCLALVRTVPLEQKFIERLKGFVISEFNPL